MSEHAGPAAPEELAGSSRRLAILLAMAMFVLVVDTSLMNVSISAVVHDLDTTVSGVQSAIALEALVSAAFILIGSKVGDLIGRKRAYVLGLLGYAIGALAMTLAQSLTAIIIFWAIIGGLGASLLLPAMQSLIHGNFEGAAQKQAYALVGAAAAIAAAVGPLLGGFITTYLSWRVGVPARGRRSSRSCCRASGWSGTCPTPGRARSTSVGAMLSVARHGWHRAGHPGVAGGRRGRRPRSWPSARSRWRRSPTGSVRRKREAQADAARPGPVPVQALPARDHRADAPADRPRRRDDRAADLPADGARVQRDGGRSVARPALAEHVRRGDARRQEGRATGARASIIRVGLRSAHRRDCWSLLPIVPRADSGWYLVIPLVIAGSGLGLLVSQLNNYTLAPISEERVSEAAGVNSAGGLVRAVVRAGLRRRDHAGHAVVHLHHDGREQHRARRPTSSSRWRQALEDDAEVMSNTQLEEQLAGQPAGRPGRDHPHQHRRPAPRPAGGAARPDPRRAPRAAQLVPHDAAAGPGAVELGRGHGPRVTPTRPRLAPGRPGTVRSPSRPGHGRARPWPIPQGRPPPEGAAAATTCPSRRRAAGARRGRSRRATPCR